MSFREKSAWITLLTVLVSFGIYFGAIVTGQVRGFQTLFLLVFCVIGLVALQIVLSAVAAMTTPKDELAVKDEREMLILWRAQSLGYYVLTVMALGLFVPVHFGHSALDMANFALLGVVVATLVVAVAQIVMFRRGV
jgi:hypothetical protein